MKLRTEPWLGTASPLQSCYWALAGLGGELLCPLVSAATLWTPSLQSHQATDTKADTKMQKIIKFLPADKARILVNDAALGIEHMTILESNAFKMKLSQF